MRRFGNILCCKKSSNSDPIALPAAFPYRRMEQEFLCYALFASMTLQISKNKGCVDGIVDKNALSFT